jgi:hypothetical protein
MEKRNGCTRREIFFLRRTTVSGRPSSGPRPAAATDVLGGDLGGIPRKNDGPLEDVRQLANIAGPGMLLKSVEGAG